MSAHISSRSSRVDATAPKKLSIVFRSVSELKPDPKNSRLHSKRQIQQISQSIRAFGFNVPLLVGAAKNIIAGHGRLEASKLLGLKKVPTISLEHLTPEQVRAFMIADNRLTEIGGWDDRLLGEQLQMLAEANLDFSLEATGFEMAEIDLRIESLSEPTNADDPADQIPPLEARQVSREGDLWLLGRHRVACGDATKTNHFKALMAGKRAAAVFADAPYNLRIDKYVANFGKTKHREFAVASGEMSSTEFTLFLEKAFRNLAHFSRSGSLHFQCLDWRHLPEFLAAGMKTYSEFKNLCVWVKNSAGQGSLWRSQHELIAVFKAGKDSHRNNIQLGKYGRYRTNVWDFRRVNGAAGSDGGEIGLAKCHPSVKPFQLVADAILDTTERNDIVLDPFLGSGTTVIAAERTGRICYGLEIDPGYVDIIVRRWQTLTGKTAVNAISKKTFRALEEEEAGA